MSRPPPAPPPSPRAATGIPGLDQILGGGLPVGHVYLVRGTPGVGKTTLGIQFLLEGRRRGESTLYITLSETRAEVDQVAASHGWDLTGVTSYELSSIRDVLQLEENTLYEPADVELKEILRVLLDEVERVKPTRVVFDSLSEVRLLASTAARYRRQMLALKQFFAGRGCTALLLDDESGGQNELQVESISHGVLTLEHLPTHYGRDRRRLRVAKLRGTVFRSGYHDFDIVTGGLAVYPRLVAAEHRVDIPFESLPSGVPELDELLGGGLDRGTTTLIMGPAGSGKSSLSMQFVCAAARRGERAAAFLFDERVPSLRRRCAGIGLDLDSALADGRITLRTVDPAELAPDEFVDAVCRAVAEGARVVLLDSLAGYFQAMPETRFLALQMHELLSFTSSQGVAMIMTLAQSGIAGTAMTAPVDVSYLSDNILLLRYFEAHGRLRKALSVVKKRSGRHEDTIREVTFDQRVRLGPPLREFSGILTGVPQVNGARAAGGPAP